MLSYKLNQVYPHVFKLTDLTAFAIAPSLFLTVKYFTKPREKRNIKDVFHFLPVLSFPVVNAKYFFVFSSEELASILKSSPNKEIYEYLKIFLVIQCFIYLILASIYLYRYSSNLKKYDTTNTNPLKWLNNFVLGVGLMFVVWIVDRNGLFREVISISYSFCIFYFGYWMINQREVFPYSEANKKVLAHLLSEQKEIEKPKYKKLHSKKSIKEIDKEHLVRVMEVQKPYLDTNLTIFKLARLYGSSVHELSFIINQGFGENFNQFVNRYRVEESKRLLADKQYDHLNMLGIAYESGFNSKTVFNSTFKKNVGKTPVQYKKNCSKL